MGNRSVGLLGLGVVVGLAALLYFAAVSPSVSRLPSRSERVDSPPIARNADLLEVPRAELGTRQIDSLPALEPVPTVVSETPAVPVPIDTVGSPDSWPAEYANKSVEALLADEVRLRAEDGAEMAAEIEKRFAEGRVETFRQDERPTERVTFGRLVGRGDETHIRYVEIDPRYDPQFFRKSSKANWLKAEIDKRTSQH